MFLHWPRVPTVAFSTVIPVAAAHTGTCHTNFGAFVLQRVPTVAFSTVIPVAAAHTGTCHTIFGALEAGAIASK
jgi:hypothetical protein